jgi:hypothetical protein
VCNKQVKSITDSEKTDDAEQLSSELFIEGLQLKQNWRASNPIKMCAYVHTYLGQSCQMVHIPLFIPKIPMWVYFGGSWN